MALQLINFLPPASLHRSQKGFDSEEPSMTQRLSCGNQVEQIAIYYGGRIWVCDATELQARAIIWMARRELEERMKKSTSQWSKAVSTTVQARLHCPPGVSMKKSLKHFLERRKRRIQASCSSPYQR